MLLSLQAWEASNVPALLEALAVVMPTYTVEFTDLSVMPFSQAVSVLRLADIFVFGTQSEVSPLLVFRTQGTVSVELMPLRQANPIARNLAVLTNHVHLSWQQQAQGVKVRSLKADVHDAASQSVMTLDIAAISEVLRSAAMVVASNVGDNFNAADGVTPLQQQECVWCSEGQKAFQCT